MKTIKIITIMVFLFLNILFANESVNADLNNNLEEEINNTIEIKEEEVLDRLNLKSDVSENAKIKKQNINIKIKKTTKRKNVKSKVDCLILKDENSIICKFSTDRVPYDRLIKVTWINPKGEVSRSRVIKISSGHSSIYDFRYANGRQIGIWTFKAVDDNLKEFKTNFEIKTEEEK